MDPTPLSDVRCPKASEASAPTSDRTQRGHASMAATRAAPSSADRSCKLIPR